MACEGSAGYFRCPAGVRRAIAEALAGASWQRCWVHFVRNMLARVPKHAHPMVTALVRTIFAQPDQASARHQLEQLPQAWEGRFHQVAALLREAAKDVLAAVSFPAGALASGPLYQRAGPGRAGSWPGA